MASALLAIDPGPFTTFQDLGWSGRREWGVPVGGSFDARSSATANALLGNPADCAVMEATLAGGVFLADGMLAIALAGAPANALILGADGVERPFRTPGCTTIRPGEKLIVGRFHQGARAYLAVHGGWQTPVLMGSRSSETRIAPGEPAPCRSVDRPIPARHLQAWGWVDPTAEPLRIIDGPDRPRFDDSPPGGWEGREWTVGANSNRMGLRLNGPPVLLDPAATSDRLSAPVAPGAVQAVAGGLIILGVAGGTMGGYPHVAHVVSADIGRLAQLRPGDPIRFRRIEPAEARALDSASRRADRLFLDRLRVIAGNQSF